jgi:hypothetical protein
LVVAEILGGQVLEQAQQLLVVVGFAETLVLAVVAVVTLEFS